jgi:hypothetical protein
VFLVYVIIYLVGVGITYEALKGSAFDISIEISEDAPPFGVLACIVWPVTWGLYVPLNLGARITRRIKNGIKDREYLPSPRDRRDD